MSNSTEKTKYLLDTNILIGFSIWAPIYFHGDFWSKLADSLTKGDWVLLDVVVGEIKYNKSLERWCEEQKKRGLVIAISDNDRDRAIEINNQYKMIDDTTQNSVADPYLIAYAEANKLGIVTREIHKEHDKDLWKIPDVCGALNIEVLKKPEDFLKKIGFQQSISDR